MFDNLKRIATKIAGKVPLRTVIIAPFVLQIVGTVGLVGYLCFTNGQKAVEDLAYQLIDQVGEQVEQNLQHYLDVPQKINASRAAAIHRSILNWKDVSVLESYFAEQLKIYPTASSIAIATEKKEFLAVERLLTTDSLVIRVQNQSTNNAFHYYAADRQGKRQKLTKIRKDFDPHNDPPHGKPWYREAKQANRSIWLPVVSLSQGVDNPVLMIANFSPFQDQNGTFQGILGSTVFMPQFASFLASLKIGLTGQTFIIDHKGLLIASSTGETPFKQTLDANHLQNLNPQDWRLPARNSKNTLTQESVNFLLSRFSNFNQITQKEKFAFNYRQNRHFLRVTPIQKESELEWLIVTVVPESDFMGQIYAHTKIIILLCLIALLGSIGIGLITAHWIIKPILQLNTAAEEIAKGEWHKTVKSDRSDELGQLAASFNTMAEQLQKSFAALQESENRLTQFLEALPVGVAVHDVFGKVRYANPAAKQLLGIDNLPNAKPEQLAETYQVYRSGTKQLYPVEEMPSMQALLGESCTTEDMELHRSDAEDSSLCGHRIVPLEVWATPIYDETGQIVSAIAAFTDITERKQAQKVLADYNETLEHQVIERTAALRDSEHRISTLLDNLPGYVYRVANDLDYTPQFISEGVFLVTGYRQEEYLIDRTISCGKEIYSADVNPVWEIVQSAIAAKQPYECEYRIITKLGTQKWVWERGRGIYGQNEELLFLEGFVTDITVRKLAEQSLRQLTQIEQEKSQELECTLRELRKTQSQLVQAEKMSSLGQMVAGIAHEINNPVSFIYGNLTPARQYHQDLLSLVEAYQQTYPNPTPQIQLLTKEIDLDFVIEDWSKLMNSMQIGAERIGEIVRSLQNFSRLDEKDLKPVDIHEGIDNTLLIVQHRLKAHSNKPEIQVNKDYGKLPLVTCYANQLNQVFMNLLNNAIDALKNKSYPRLITIRTSLVLGKEPKSNLIMIRITDNGSGISEEVMNQIFDPFFTTKPVGSGTGLGLAISYQIIVDKHQGQIRCVSDLGQGTEFVVEIPVRSISRTNN
jgi:PAS domain S-box-containing protein